MSCIGIHKPRIPEPESRSGSATRTAKQKDHRVVVSTTKPPKTQTAKNPKEAEDQAKPKEKRAEESVCKPDSVPGRPHDQPRSVTIYLGPPSPTSSCGLPANLGRATLDRPRGRRDAHLGLAPGGVYRATSVTRGAGGLLHHRFTLTRRVRRAVCFLWHCPAGRPGLPLATTLLCGVRTFLDGSCPPRSLDRLFRSVDVTAGWAGLSRQACSGPAGVQAQWEMSLTSRTEALPSG
ncbi:hypothetical protein SAMN05660874_04208 [Saccharopolyspora flava]|uniref:Uncharacterized protein n=1 Tax=Saccharopolyspora flava TaxID=95161 RepID=A0A1I6TTA7_9PSEU|nr:hypothetical protein SAMN05660874_04208 [Saccharopolyspora flava]